MAIKEKLSEIQKFSILKVIFFSLKFVGTVFVKIIFVGTVFVGIAFVISIISSHVNTELIIILLKYLPILQAHVLGFQI